MVKPVMVVGGGIAGIQAAYDLAEMGIPVHLIEKSPALGGKMSQLDKTFPTNDCSTCIISPKISDCYNHKLITTHSYSEVENITGTAGNFNVKVREKSRFIDLDECTACGDCADVCPVILKNDYDENLAPRKASYRPFPQAVPASFTISKKNEPPCRNTCPSGVNVQGYMALTAEGKFKEAIELIRKNTPLPGICGRVCTHPCESECNRKNVDEPLAIREVKRFLADWEERNLDKLEDMKVEPFPADKNKKVAVIGSGPGGLSAAYYLRKTGYNVTVFEKLPVLGGTLRVGIPSYRLPEEVLDQEIDIIRRRGVEFKTGVEFGKDITMEQLFADGYEAVFAAPGTRKARKLRLDGEDNSHVLEGLKFLYDVNMGEKNQIEGKVGVIGGGNTAIDAARTALRLGADEVKIIYRRSQAEMPASIEEVEAALEEGIEILELKSPDKLVFDGDKLTGMECVQMELGTLDDSGRPRPLPVEGKNVTLKLDWVINAIGQVPEGTLSGLEDTSGKWGWLNTNEVTMATSIQGVFAGGDATGGNATAIDAIGNGRRAAEMIDVYLQEGWEKIEALNKEGIKKKESERDFDEDVEKVARHKPGMLAVSERINTFDEVENCLTEEEAIAEAKRCLHCAICSDCRECEKVCDANAIHHDMEDNIFEENVGAVILAAGYELFDPVEYSEYGYSRYPNIVTSLEYERISSASGPTGGHIERPSDGIMAKRIAYIHCSGSRDVRIDKNYCSSVCCMHSIKQAVITKEHEKDTELDLYYMDIRAFGKGFERYFNSAKATSGINFIRSKVSDIEEDENNNLILKSVAEDGTYHEEKYDLVVLAAGFKPNPQVTELMKKFKIRVNKYGFAAVNELEPLSTSREGIFACGVITGPKDIPESVIQASGAAARAAEIVGVDSSNIGGDDRTYRFTDNEMIKTGVFVCHCGTNIGGVVDVDWVAEEAKKLPFVAHSEAFKYTCSSDSQQIISERIREKGLNRLVIASCTPRTHEPLFREVAARGGINPYLTVMTNIRDQDSWVHRDEKEKATDKAMDLVKGAVAKSWKAHSLYRSEIEKLDSAIVVGGGVSGMNAALRLAQLGFPVNIIEREKELGGNARKLMYTMDGRPAENYLNELVQIIENHPLIKVYNEYEVEKIAGYVGNYNLELKPTASNEDQSVKDIEGAVIIVATGAVELDTDEYLAGQDERVISQLNLENKMKENSLSTDLEKVFMIQCVGSREDGREYCSRLCCTQSVSNAIHLKERNPELDITVFYREMRTYGLYEDKYRKARELGINFVRYDVDNKPEVRAEEDGLVVTYHEPITCKDVSEKGDLLVLAKAIVPEESNRMLSQHLKVPLSEDGFFLEAHVKLRPVDFATDGVYLCGLAHGPKNLGESIAISNAAASRAATVLAREYLLTEPMIAYVDQKICSGCGACTDVCAYQAVTIDEEKGIAQVNNVLCKGCGNCNAACRSHAINLNGFSHEQIVDEMEAILEGPVMYTAGGIANE